MMESAAKSDSEAARTPFPEIIFAISLQIYRVDIRSRSVFHFHYVLPLLLWMLQQLKHQLNVTLPQKRLLICKFCLYSCALKTLTHAKNYILILLPSNHRYCIICCNHGNHYLKLLNLLQPLSLSLPQKFQ